MNQRQPWPQLRESAPGVIAGHLEIASSADPARRRPHRRVHLERLAQPSERAGRKRAQRDCGGNRTGASPPLILRWAQLTRRHPGTGLLPKCRSRPVLRHESAYWRQSTPIAGALASIGDRSEDTQNKADMRPVTCAIGMAVGRSESAIRRAFGESAAPVEVAPCDVA